MSDVPTPIDDLVTGILESIRPKLAAALQAAHDHGRRQTEASYDEQMTEMTKALNGAAAQLTASMSRLKASTSKAAASTSVKDDIPTGTYWLDRRAALGTVKPRILELVSRHDGASVQEIEAIGIKPNSVRGTLYSLQKDGIIRRDGDRWYAATPQSNEAPAEAEAH